MDEPTKNKFVSDLKRKLEAWTGSEEVNQLKGGMFRSQLRDLATEIIKKKKEDTERQFATFKGFADTQGNEFMRNLKGKLLDINQRFEPLNREIAALSQQARGKLVEKEEEERKLENLKSRIASLERGISTMGKVINDTNESLINSQIVLKITALSFANSQLLITVRNMRVFPIVGASLIITIAGNPDIESEEELERMAGSQERIVPHPIQLGRGDRVRVEAKSTLRSLGNVFELVIPPNP